MARRRAVALGSAVFSSFLDRRSNCPTSATLLRHLLRQNGEVDGGRMGRPAMRHTVDIVRGRKPLPLGAIITFVLAAGNLSMAICSGGTSPSTAQGTSRDGAAVP